MRKPINPEQYGGAAAFRRFLADEVIPYARDPQLAVRRLLLGGLPGTGKTLAAQLLAGALNCECIVLSLAAAKDQYQGSAARNLLPKLRTVAALSKESPCVVVLDEVDKVTTGHAGDSGSGEAWTILADHLQEDDSRAIYMGTANWIDRLDPALLQRFGEGWFFDLPNLAERNAIALIHAERLGMELKQGALAELAGATADYSAREIAEKVMPSLARISRRSPTVEHVRQVIGATSPASRSQQEQIAKMKSAAAMLRNANETTQPAAEEAAPTRRIRKGP